MRFNEHRVKGKWLEIKGELQKAWGKLTDDDLERTKGDLKTISGLIQQRYGEEQEKSNTKLTDIFRRFESKNDSVVGAIKKTIKNK